MRLDIWGIATLCMAIGGARLTSAQDSESSALCTRLPPVGEAAPGRSPFIEPENLSGERLVSLSGGSIWRQSVASAGAPKPEAGADSAAPSASLEEWYAACDDCAHHGWNVWSGFDSFKSIVDGATQSNFGVVTGANYGTRLGRFSELTGIGAQLGGSYGAYDWDGRSNGIGNQTQAQTQIFLTTGLFRRASADCNWSLGVVHDWMLNNNYGSLATSPTLSQWRGQIAYAWNPRNEIGVYTTVRDLGHSEQAQIGATTIAVSFQAYNQTNVFWHHKWDYGADSYFWLGTPANRKLGFDGGSLGDFILGSSFTAPLTEHWGLYGNGQYMFPSAHSGGGAAIDNAWNVGFGLVWYPGTNSRTATVAGNRWMPYLPVANNSTFLVDTNLP